MRFKRGGYAVNSRLETSLHLAAAEGVKAINYDQSNSCGIMGLRYYGSYSVWVVDSALE